MKKLLSMLSIITISSGVVATVIINSSISTKLESIESNKINLKSLNQFTINRDDFRIIFNTERWGNNFVMRFSHSAVEWLHRNSRNARDVMINIVSVLGIAEALTNKDFDAIGRILGVSIGVATMFYNYFSRINENPQSLVDSIVNNENEDQGNGLDLSVRESGTGHVSIAVRRANTYPF